MRLIPKAPKNKKIANRPTISQLKQRRITVLAVIIVFLVGVTGTVWSAVSSGWVENKMDLAKNSVIEATAAAGMVVESIYLRGSQATSRSDLLETLDIKKGTPILNVDIKEARLRVESLGWVKSATLVRVLPNVIFLDIKERKALALWQRNRRAPVLIDTDGTVIQKRNLAKYSDLPLVVGQGAAKNAAVLIERLHEYPLIFNEVKVAIRVSERRWNLRLRNNIEIRLPAEKISTALNQLYEYQNKHSLFDRNIIAVDLRVPDRLIVRVNNQEKKQKKVIGENT
ncbi:MAG: cell division protein FtsQ/DivIB [Alphaproteobacteria bacterium]|nr:cell division protein FtsQ/DivIB [Alphaproteobacteria bacterium]